MPAPVANVIYGGSLALNGTQMPMRCARLAAAKSRLPVSVLSSTSILAHHGTPTLEEMSEVDLTPDTQVLSPRLVAPHPLTPALYDPLYRFIGEAGTTGQSPAPYTVCPIGFDLIPNLTGVATDGSNRGATQVDTSFAPQASYSIAGDNSLTDMSRPDYPCYGVRITVHSLLQSVSGVIPSFANGTYPVVIDGASIGSTPGIIPGIGTTAKPNWPHSSLTTLDGVNMVVQAMIYYQTPSGMSYYWGVDLMSNGKALDAVLWFVDIPVTGARFSHVHPKYSGTPSSDYDPNILVFLSTRLLSSSVAKFNFLIRPVFWGHLMSTKLDQLSLDLGDGFITPKRVLPSINDPLYGAINFKGRERG